MHGKHKQREEWLRDVEARQRNVVFPDTVQNEARFWRNLGKGPSSTSAKAGLVVLAIFVFVSAAMILVATYTGGVLWEFVLGMILFCGSIFGAIAWATRRSLRNMENTRRKR
ncbi:MAG TPA: hypothetical protein VN901_16965 [Candidatus Acidoferrales bacterium]|nr:hypothetical protein [Candidatus Acidoferrales bacterium]